MYLLISINFWCFRFVFGLLSHFRIFFIQMETSILPMKRYKFWPTIVTHGHWSVRVLLLATPTVTGVIRLLWSCPRTRAVTLAFVAERWAVELSLPDFTTPVCSDRGSYLDLPHVRRSSLCHCYFNPSYMTLFYRFEIILERNTLNVCYLVSAGFHPINLATSLRWCVSYYLCG